MPGAHIDDASRHGVTIGTWVGGGAVLYAAGAEPGQVREGFHKVDAAGHEGTGQGLGVNMREERVSAKLRSVVACGGHSGKRSLPAVRLDDAEARVDLHRAHAAAREREAPVARRNGGWIACNRAGLLRWKPPHVDRVLRLPSPVAHLR
jgi:hypothetical protein